MSDLTEFFRNFDKKSISSFVHANEQRSTDDLIKEMNEAGLRVNYLDTTGSLVRVPVLSSGQARGDRSQERSGWYCCNQLANGQYVALYGNWRTGEEHKWTSYNSESLSVTQQQELRDLLDKNRLEQEENKRIKQNEVAKDVQSRYERSEEIFDHPYLDHKGIKNYGLRELSGALIVPIYNIEGELRSLQYIRGKKGEKRFVSGGEIKGNLHLIGTDFASLKQLSQIVICEGYATSASVRMATNSPVAICFSANFAYDVVKNLRKKTDCEIVLALDNDESGLGAKKAQHIQNDFFNIKVRLPSEVGDYNDLHLAKGLDQVRLDILNKGLGLRNLSIKTFTEDPPPREWLIEGLLELGKPAVLASIGGIGKSGTVISSALEIAGCGSGEFLGKKINSHGDCLIVSCEDDSQEIWRRIASIDPEGKRFKSDHDVFVYTVPDKPKPLIFLQDDSQGLRLSDQAYEFLDELNSFDNLRMVVLDPIQSLVQAPITTSQEAAQLYTQFVASIASKLNVVCLSVHHMSKLGLQGADLSDLDLRSAIRGSSALVDGHRLAWILAPEKEERVKSICAEEGLDYDRFRVVRSQVVKANSSEVDTNMKTLIRRKAFLELYERRSFTWE